MISPMAPLCEGLMRQTLRYQRYVDSDVDGQPIYGGAKEVRCRFTSLTNRTAEADGDMVSVSGMQIIVPASTEIQARDRVVLNAPYAEGAVIGKVETALDPWGNPTHKVVTVL